MTSANAGAVRRTPMHSVRVTSVRPLTPRMRRITVGGPSLHGIEVAPAQDVEVILSDGAGHRLKRRYTVRAARPEVGEFDIDALVHEHGPGGRWAGSVRPGDELDLLGPRGHLELRPADWHLFVGDEASLPAFAALIAALPTEAQSLVLAEVDGPADQLDLGRATVTWVHRGAHPPGGVELLEAVINGLEAPLGSGRAYLLGESRAMVALRPAVERLGIGADRCFVKGYWNRGRGARRVPAG